MLSCLLCVPTERDPLHQGIIVERAKLKQRDFALDLTSRLGKSQVITSTTPLNQQVTEPPESLSRLCSRCTLERMKGKKKASYRSASTAST